MTQHPLSEGPNGTQEIYRGRRYVVSRWTEDAITLVLKQPRRGALATSSTALLQHEYQLLRELEELRTPGIVKAFALQDMQGMPVLVLADAGPYDLREWLKRNPFEPGTFLELALQLAGILEGLHRHHVIHRDFNPSNIIVARGMPRVTVIDFDLAIKLSGTATSESLLGELDSTLPYIAPEQTGRMDRLVDHRADLYSLGATFYEMLTGQPPFTSTDAAELVHAHLARPPLPPALANPKVPELLSELVLKLLAKMPEERYQSAESLLSDLQEARKRLRASGALHPFELGGLDRARQLSFPERLYGRERELAQLEAALARIRTGPSETVMVTGTAGAGKSTLVQALRQRLGAGCWFLSGKFDQLQGNVPYAPLVTAFQGLLGELLRTPAEHQDGWRRRLLEALGTDGHVLLGVVPEWEQLLGAQPPVAGSGPVDAERRLHRTFQAFVQALATPEHPLVLFLDDLHWADPASLELFRSLASNPDSRHVLWVGSYRTEEVGPEHPVARILAALQEAGAAVHSIAIPPLDLEALTALCGDTLHREPEHLRPLARLVLSKTAGNPLFVIRFLRYLHHSGLLRFDAGRGTWDWDLARIARVDMTENVVELMVATIRQLPERTQSLLKVAACLGNRVELPLLAALMDMPRGDTARALRSAYQEGLLVHEGEAVYRFSHDRVQQAAYSLLTEDQKKRLHLEAGRQMRGSIGREPDERLFDVVDQLDLGAELVTDEAERLELAWLNFRAGCKAKESVAFRSSLGYLTRGIALLPRDAWRANHSLAFSLHREAAECAHLAGDQRLAERLVSSAMTHAASRAEKADLYTLQLISCMARQAFQEGIRWGREGLRLFALELPSRQDAAQAIQAEFAAVKENLRGRSTAELLEEPLSEDPDHLACLRLLSEVGLVLFYLDPFLFAFTNVRVVNLSLKHGNSVHSSVPYAVYGGLLPSHSGDYDSGYAFGRLGVELCQRYPTPRLVSRTLVTFALGVNHWKAPLRTSMPHLRMAFTSADASGDVSLATYTFPATVNTLFSMGTGFSQLLSELETDIAYARKAGLHWRIQSLISLRQALRCLRDRTREGAGFEDDTFHEEAFLTANRELPTVRCMYWIQRLQVSYLFGDVETAREMSRRASEIIEFLRGWYLIAEHNFYTSLTLVACSEKSAPPERAGLLERIAANQRQLGVWADNCPENFRHKYQLVCAELARLEGRDEEAMRLYEQAIEGAHREEFHQDEALANELASRYYRALGVKRLADICLRAAIDGYARWGAQAKVSALEEEFPDLVPVGRLDRQPPASTPPDAESGGSALDLSTLLKSAETLVSEVVLERLLEKLMGVCLEAAGAQRGALVLDEKDTLTVRAVGAVSEPVSLVRTALKESDQVPTSVIEGAFLSGETLVLADAAHQEGFSSDPYVAQHTTKSALAIPIQRFPRTVGVLYLENNLATRAFTPERVRLLRLLSSQIAISLENSLLFERLRIEVDERRRAESTVRFLAESSLALAESLDLETTLNRITRLVVPRLADWCLVIVKDKGGMPRPVAITHVDPNKEPRLRDFMEQYLAKGESASEALLRVLRTGQPLLLPEITDSVVEENQPGRAPRYIELLRALSTRTGMYVPLVARGKTLGAIVFFSGVPGRHYGQADLDLAQELARRAAVCIDNAWLYRDSQEAIRLRDDFLSVASHELNTPITSLRLSVQGLLRRASTELPENAQRALRHTEQQTRRLAELVTELLDVSRIRAGSLYLRLEQVELTEVLHHVIERFGESLNRANCPLSLQAREPVTGRWDRLRLEQVVGNLLSNAIKFAPGRPIELELLREGDTARLVVKDHGIGIAPERLPHVFGRFERAVSPEKYGGLGLGLYIVREIVTALGGSIRVESEPGVGTTFTVELPCHGPPSALTSNPSTLPSWPSRASALS
ncbi:AAA family ATPase [Archangium violaceum]|uniref:AAA family ATPase n=1 Tax=Archangium violaceum TaxID=83451 RepID=UPI00193B4600|nr:AAA family ATPase [Archangium violaceum]QRK07690.1 AAA family ATPase [Archangium violaceum]